MNLFQILFISLLFNVSCTDNEFTSEQRQAIAADQTDDSKVDSKVDSEIDTDINTPTTTLYAPDGEGGFKEIESIFQRTDGGLEKIDELIQKSIEDTFEKIRNNESGEGETLITLNENELPEGFEEAKEGIYIKTEDGFVKVDLFLPKTTTAVSYTHLTLPTILLV